MEGEDAYQMCALQMQAESGPYLMDNSAKFEEGIEKFLVKQVVDCCFTACSRHASFLMQCFSTKGFTSLSSIEASGMALEKRDTLSDTMASQGRFLLYPL